jgi:hypothetical protein
MRAFYEIRSASIPLVPARSAGLIGYLFVLLAARVWREDGLELAVPASIAYGTAVQRRAGE